MKVVPLLTAAGIFVLGASGAVFAPPVPSPRATHEVVATIPTGSSAAGLAFAARTGLLYVTNIFSDNVSVIDPRTRSVVDTVPLVGGNDCAHPFGVGYDKKHDTIYVACQQFTAATAIDARTNTPIGDPIEVGSSPFGIAYDERNGDVYIAIAHDNDVTVVDGDTRKVIDHIPVGEAPFGIAYDGRRGFLYVTNAQSDTVSVIDGATNTVVRTIPVAPGQLPAGLAPMGIAYDGRNDTIYVANFGGSTVSAIDARTGELVSEVFVGGGPFGIALNTRDGDIYVPTFFDGTVEVIDSNTNLDVESIPVGPSPVWAAADPRSGEVFVTQGDAVSVLAAREGPSLLRIRPRMVNFGAQPIGTSEGQLVTVTNVSGQTLFVSVTARSVPDDFSTGGGLPGTTCPSPDQGPFGPGESCTQFVGFNPSEFFTGCTRPASSRWMPSTR